MSAPFGKRFNTEQLNCGRQRKSRQRKEDESPGWTDPPGAQAMARCCREARAVQKISGQPAGATIVGASFIAVGLGEGVQNFAVDGDGF